MNSRVICLLATLSCLPAGNSAPAAALKAPNILLITADDLGNQLSCYGERRIRTPDLDWLAAQGVRFTEMNSHTANHFAPQRTVRDARHKLVLNLTPQADQTPVELFDLRDDPEETRDLVDEPELAAVRRRLEAALQQWRKRTDDPLADPARLERWQKVTEEWKRSAPRLAGGPYPDVARVPPGGLELLK